MGGGKCSSCSSSSSSTTSEGCFQCGETDHWVRSCPWKESPCPSGCQGTRKLWTSRQKKSYGKKFLKCLQCGSFEWLYDVITKCKPKTNIVLR